MEQDFKAGDVVQLKSGGPRMTIENIDNYAFSEQPEMKAKCTSFEKTVHKEDLFALVTLSKI